MEGVLVDSRGTPYRTRKLAMSQYTLRMRNEHSHMIINLPP